MKWMKTCLFICVFICLLSIGANAAESTSYVLDDVGITITLPEGHMAFTREIDDADPNLAAWGTTKESQLDLMEQLNQYLRIRDTAQSYEITVTMEIRNNKNLNDCTDTELQEFLAHNKEALASTDIIDPSCELFDHAQTRFLKAVYPATTSSDQFCGVHYYTVYGGKDINILLRSLTGSYDPSMDTILRTIIDGIQFHEPADERPFFLKELNMTLSLPDSHIVYAKGMPTDDPVYTSYGMTSEHLQEEDIQFEAVAADGTYMILINVGDATGFASFNALPDSELKNIATNVYAPMYENIDYVLTEVDVFDNPQSKFLKVSLTPSSPDREDGMIQYIHIRNEQIIILSFAPLTGKPIESYDTLLEQIVNSIHFEAPSKKSSLTEQAEVALEQDEKLLQEAEELPKEDEEHRWIPVAEKYGLPPTPKKTVVPTGLILTAVGLGVLCVIIAICRYRAKKREEE